MEDVTEENEENETQRTSGFINLYSLSNISRAIKSNRKMGEVVSRMKGLEMHKKFQ
jgi:hypothetical protein